MKQLRIFLPIIISFHVYAVCESLKECAPSLTGMQGTQTMHNIRFTIHT